MQRKQRRHLLCWRRRQRKQRRRLLRWRRRRRSRLRRCCGGLGSRPVSWRKNSQRLRRRCCGGLGSRTLSWRKKRRRPPSPGRRRQPSSRNTSRCNQIADGILHEEIPFLLAHTKVGGPHTRHLRRYCGGSVIAPVAARRRVFSRAHPAPVAARPPVGAVGPVAAAAVPPVTHGEQRETRDAGGCLSGNGDVGRRRDEIDGRREGRGKGRKRRRKCKGGRVTGWVVWGIGRCWVEVGGRAG